MFRSSCPRCEIAFELFQTCDTRTTEGIIHRSERSTQAKGSVTTDGLGSIHDTPHFMPEDMRQMPLRKDRRAACMQGILNDPLAGGIVPPSRGARYPKDSLPEDHGVSGSFNRRLSNPTRGLDFVSCAPASMSKTQGRVRKTMVAKSIGRRWARRRLSSSAAPHCNFGGREARSPAGATGISRQPLF